MPRLFLLVAAELVGVDAVPGHGQHGGRGRLRDGLTLALGEEAAQAGVFGGAVVEGGRQVYEGVTHDNTQETTVGGVKVAGGALIAGSLVADGSLVGIPVGVGMAVVGAAMVGGAAIYENVAGHGEEH